MSLATDCLDLSSIFNAQFCPSICWYAIFEIKPRKGLVFAMTKVDVRHYILGLFTLRFLSHLYYYYYYDLLSQEIAQIMSIKILRH